MSIKKTVGILAVAGALAAISVPAMALENEFHGLYNFNTTFSNFQNGGSGDFNPGAGWNKNRQMNNYMEQRARLQYIAKVSDDLKMYTQFEIDHRYGDGNADLDTDSMNVEVKHAYIDFNLGSNFNTKIGLQPYRDTIKGLLIDADVPAIMTTTKLGAYTLGLGFTRYDDDAAIATQRLGDNNKDLFIWDNTIAITKDTKVALSYYFLADYAAGTTGGHASLLDLANTNQDILLNTLAASAEAKAGPATVSGFFAMQAGHQKQTGPNGYFGAAKSSTYLHGWAANVAAKIAAGPGALKTGFLFTSGNNSDSSAHYKGWITSSVNSYNEGGMMILARNTGNSPTSTDRFIRRNVTNIALATVGFDANLTEKMFLNTNMGFAWAPSSTDAPVYKGTKANSGDFMGAELNLEAGYKVYSNLTLKAQAAYMMLGGYYTGTALDGTKNAARNPENPYTMRLHAQFKF